MQIVLRIVWSHDWAAQRILQHWTTVHRRHTGALSLFISIRLPAFTVIRFFFHTQEGERDIVLLTNYLQRSFSFANYINKLHSKRPLICMEELWVHTFTDKIEKPLCTVIPSNIPITNTLRHIIVDIDKLLIKVTDSLGCREIEFVYTGHWYFCSSIFVTKMDTKIGGRYRWVQSNTYLLCSLWDFLYHNESYSPFLLISWSFPARPKEKNISMKYHSFSARKTTQR